MDIRLKIMLLSVIACFGSVGLMEILDNYVLKELPNWTMSLSNKTLLLELTTFDRYLVRLFPLLTGIVMLLAKVKDQNVYIRIFFRTLLSVILFFIIAIITALFTWNSDVNEYISLPEFLRYQPFSYYWTPFIALGVLVPSVFFWFRNRKEDA